jgi:hypothetical protein
MVFESHERITVMNEIKVFNKFRVAKNGTNVSVLSPAIAYSDSDVLLLIAYLMLEAEVTFDQVQDMMEKVRIFEANARATQTEAPSKIPPKVPHMIPLTISTTTQRPAAQTPVKSILGQKSLTKEQADADLAETLREAAKNMVKK